MVFQYGPLTLKEIRRVARVTVETLANCDLNCCLFGSAACAIYGMANRVPNVSDSLFTLIRIFKTSIL